MSCQQPPPPPQPFPPSDGTSDYGSDFSPEQEALVDELLANVATEHESTLVPPVSASGLAPTPARELTRGITLPTTTPPGRDIEDYYAQTPSRAPRVLGREKPSATWHLYRADAAAASRTRDWVSKQGSGDRGAAAVEAPNSLEGRARNRERDIAREHEWTTAAAATPATDTNTGASRNPGTNPSLTPIERFRRPPNKAFSVSDLISPSWCELQYWYTLTKYGRKRRTAAMKAGTTIHKTLEDEVHTTKEVKIMTTEDGMALRIWNIIQGLRTLREFGMTRELEVWGVVDGELVNGVIDQLSYECPDPELEASAAAHYADVEASRERLPEYQMSLTDYLLSSQQGRKMSDIDWGRGMPFDEGEEEVPPPPPEAYDIPRVFLSDNKTRGSGSAPTVKSTSFRPTMLQLQFYYHFLNRLVTSDDVTIDTLAHRYNFDPERPFTVDFIAEVGGLNDEFFDALSTPEFDPDFIPTPQDATTRTSSWQQSSASSQDSTTILSSNNNLRTLWALMKDHLRLTFLPPQDHESPTPIASSIPAETQPPSLSCYPTTLSPLLTARYISAVPDLDHDARLLANRSFLFDPVSLNEYVDDQLAWWRGNRKPRGVEVMEAWKCRICEFAEECEWRRERAFALASRHSKSGNGNGREQVRDTEREWGERDREERDKKEEETKESKSASPSRRRGRGRPRKEAKEEMKEKETRSSGNPTRRGRGRPRKVPGT